MDEKDLPSIDKFYSSLTGALSPELYDEVCEYYSKGDFKNLGELLKVYVTQDIGILADCMEFYRKFCKEMWDLDPVNYITSSSLYYDASLKVSNQELDLVHDPEMYELFEKSILGGFCSVVCREETANNIHMKGYDARPETEDSYILFPDFNSLYPGVMKEKLPVGNFNQLQRNEFVRFVKLFHEGKINHKGDTSYLIEVEYSIPDEVKRKTDDLPLSLFIASDIKGSEYTNDLLEGKSTPQGSKLIACHLHVTKYCFHVKLLELYVQLGIKVEKIRHV